MARVAEGILDHISPNMRSMPFLPPTLAHMATWRNRVKPQTLTGAFHVEAIQSS